MNDDFNIERFIEAQDKDNMYNQAYAEIKKGYKDTHWIWYVFPQHISLGKSSMNRKYGIKSIKEAQEYIANDVLRGRLINICEALYNLDTKNLISVVGLVDAYKIRSCCTLFSKVAPDCDVFDRIVEKYFNGIPCYRTIGILEKEDGMEED